MENVTLRILALSGILVLASTSFTQVAARTVWNPSSAGPTGSTSHRLRDVSWWQGPANQFGIYSILQYRTGGTRWVANAYQHSKFGDGEAGSNFQGAAGQWVYGKKVVSGPTNAFGFSTAVYFGGDTRATETSQSNILIQSRIYNLDVEWTRVLDVSEGSDDQLTHMAIDRRGNEENLYVAGRTLKGGVLRWFLAKYSGTGAFLWCRVGEPNTYATGLAIDNSGYPYLAYTLTETAFRQNRIVKHHLNGDFLWRNGYNPTTTAGCVIEDLAIVAGGPVGVGFVEAGGASVRPLATGFEGSGVRRFGFTRTTPGRYQAIAATSDAQFYAVGVDDESTTKGVISALVDPMTGSSAWTRKAAFPSQIPSQVYAKVDRWDNLYFGAATSSLATEGVGMHVGKYAPSGTVQWNLLDYTVNEYKEPNAMMVHPTTGMVWLVGAYRTPSFQLMVRAAYSQKAVATSELGMTMFRNTTFSSSLSHNDRYHDGGTYTVVTPPASGSLTVQPNGTFTYSPPVGFTGTRTFTYKIVRAGVSDSNVATASIQVL